MGEKIVQKKGIRVIKALLYSFFVFMTSSILIGLLIRFTPIPESWCNYYMLGALCIACLFLGLYVGNTVKKRGIFFGALAAIIFTLLILSLVTVFTDSQTKEGIFQARYIICYFFGSIGGMIGVNL